MKILIVDFKVMIFETFQEKAFLFSTFELLNEPVISARLNVQVWLDSVCIPYASFKTVLSDLDG